MTKYCNSTDIHPGSQKDGRKIWQTRNPSSSPCGCDLSFCFLCSVCCAQKAKVFQKQTVTEKKQPNKIYSLTLVHLAWSNENGDVP